MLTSPRRTWRTVGWGSLHPDARFVAGFLGAEGVFEVDPAPVDDRHQQDQCIDGFVAYVSGPASWILGLPLELADGPVELTDFFSELEALRGQVLLVESSLGFHPGDVVLYPGQGGTVAQWLHGGGHLRVLDGQGGGCEVSSGHPCSGANHRRRLAAKSNVWQPGVRRDDGRGAHAERSVSVNAAARAFTWRRTDAGNLPAIRSTSTLAVRAFHDQVPASMPSMMTLGRTSPIWLNARRCGKPPR